MRQCKICGAEIVYLSRAGGMKTPCNPGLVTYWKNPKGNMQVLTLNGEVIKCDLEGDIMVATGIGYIPHRVTCNDPEAFRKSL